MDSAPKKAEPQCVLGWDPSHCPLDVDCRFWSRLEDRCRYAERREAQERPFAADGRPAPGSAGRVRAR